ncbi:hypothetical protein Tco_0738125 [Tanacetum coccineum]
MGLPSTIPDEGISKTKPLLEGGNIKDKDLERYKPVADMESSTPPVITLSRTDAEYQVDQTQSTRFEDDLLEESDDDVFEAGEEMDEDIQEHETEETHTRQSTEEQHSQEHQSPLHPTKSSKLSEDAVKEDLALNKKILEATEAYTKNSTTLTELFTLVKSLEFPGIKTNVESLNVVVTTQNDHLAKWAESSTSTSWSSSSASSISVTTITIAITEVPIPQTQLTGPVIEITPPEQPESPYVTPNPDRGKGKVTNDVESPSKLVKASSEVHPDPDEPVRAHYELEERKQKAAEEANSKGGQEFRKIQDAEIKVHNREHFEKIKRSRELRKKKRKIQELEPETRIPRLECNRSLPQGIPFNNNMVIEEPEYGMFFIDFFGDEAFQRMSDIYKVDVETLLTYLVMASNF